MSHGEDAKNSRSPADAGNAGVLGCRRTGPVPDPPLRRVRQGALASALDLPVLLEREDRVDRSCDFDALAIGQEVRLKFSASEGGPPVPTFTTA